VNIAQRYAVIGALNLALAFTIYQLARCLEGLTGGRDFRLR
jgi:hypothetical protein